MISVDAINSIIAAAGRSGRPDVAIQLLNEMSSKYSAQPNERTYRSVLISCNQAEHEKRRQRKRFLRANNGKSPGFESDENDPLALFWWEAALSLFRRMKEEGLKPDMQSYSSVISACEAAGQWQRAIGVLRGMKSEENINPNLFCFNAAIAACEKGGAWLEAVELYERMQLQDSPVRPNFITMNSILIALDNAGQKEMAESIYQEAIKEKTVKPWKWTWDDESGRIRVMVSFSMVTIFASIKTDISHNCSLIMNFFVAFKGSSSFFGTDVKNRCAKCHRLFVIREACSR